MEFGKILKKLRREKMLTQKELSEMTGIGTTSIQLYENGSREPTLKNLKKIAAILGVPIEELLGWGNIKRSTNQDRDITFTLLSMDVYEFDELLGHIFEEIISLNELGQISVLKYIEFLSLQDEYKSKN